MFADASATCLTPDTPNARSWLGMSSELRDRSRHRRIQHAYVAEKTVRLEFLACGIVAHLHIYGEPQVHKSNPTAVAKFHHIS
jgi:hypothetical protein